MKDYFTHSQKIRREIENSPDLMSRLSGHMSDEAILQSIGDGSKNKHFSLGRLDSGLYVALRQFICKPYHRNTSPVKSWYESYAQNAEKYCMQGRKVSDFCIGAMKEMNAVLLIEDFTRGGTLKIKKPHTDSDFGFLEDGIQVFLDIEAKGFPSYKKFKYLDENASIVF
ncbi:hypothetical protein GOV12_05895 [Candidatus Pacearchaeota archaeon]|nr:hypothetical protein [Candidatus Pacearchaeota archaeon]